ncbi:MAG: 3-hydroxyacyl-CoA dehydrogenase NAD-binding domain-containing protein [Pseudomonadota bacterium]
MTLSPEEALAAENTAFLTLKSSDQSKALRHIFSAERQSLTDPRCQGAARDLQTLGVVGGGTMGAGISVACLLAGLSVQMVERDKEASAAGRARVESILEQSRARGILSEQGHAETLLRFSSSDDYGSLSDADLLIEAVFEDLSAKQEVFARLDAVTRPDAILATNTSYLDVNTLAASVADPSRVIGLHFFSPAHVMKLLEIVLPDAVADDVVATAARLASRLGKIGVLAGVCDGFIGNRIMSAYRHEADRLLLDGADPWDVDAAMRDFGFAMGIYQMQDLAGLDIAWAMRKRRAAETPPGDDYIAIADRICEQGRFGQKSGHGWYAYDTGKPAPSEETLQIIQAERAARGAATSALTADEIMARIIGRMQGEASEVLAEGVAAREEDIDVVMVNGYGYPRWRGGPMFALKSERLAIRP